MLQAATYITAIEIAVKDDFATCVPIFGLGVTRVAKIFKCYCFLKFSNALINTYLSIIQSLFPQLQLQTFATAAINCHHWTHLHKQPNAPLIAHVTQPLLHKSFRFMGLRAAMFTKCPGVRPFASDLGFTIFELDELSAKAEPTDELLQLLGFSGGDVLDECEFDLIFVHALSSEKPKDQREKLAINTGVDWLNKLVGAIMQMAQPGSRIASRLHFSVVLSYNTISKDAEECSLTMNTSKETDSDLYLLHPHQSYTMRGGKILNDIRHHYPMLIAQWQEGVTHKDLAKAFSFREFKEASFPCSVIVRVSINLFKLNRVESWARGSQGRSRLLRSEWTSWMLSSVAHSAITGVSVECCIDMKNLIGEAVCRICQESFSTTVTGNL